MRVMRDETEPCIFCQIVERKLPAHIVYEDDEILAFLDIRPISPGHALVIPKKHVASLAELEAPLDGRLFHIAGKIAAALRISGLRVDGINVWLADGKAAFQEIPHIHIHVIPRFPGDGIRIQAGPDYGKTLPKTELIENANKIREALGDIDQ
jgi:histidine triad (HIT) family protein